MIRLTAFSPADTHRIVYSDFFQTQRHNLILLAEAQSEVPFFEHVQRTVHQGIQKLASAIERIDDPEPLLKEFFVQLNWQLHTLLQKALAASAEQNPELGLSLFFVFAREDTLWAVQFGRMLCCLVTKQETRVVGEEWENFAIRTREKMNLIGGKGADIAVKVHRIEMPRDARFLVVNSRVAEAVREHGLSATDLGSFLQKRFAEIPFGFAVFETEGERKPRKRSFVKGKPFRITAVALFAVLAGCTLYFFQCHNEVEDQLSVMRHLRIYMERNRDREKVPEMMGEITRVMFPDADTTEVARIVDEARQIITAPASSMELQQAWSMPLPASVTQPPAFDDRRLFLVTGNTLHVYDKRTQGLLYRVAFACPVHTLLLSDANRLQITTEDGPTHSIKKDSGKITWTCAGQSMLAEVIPPQVPRQISYLDDRRLANSVLVFSHPDQIQVVNIHTGAVVTAWPVQPNPTLAFGYLSVFDPLEKALYVVSGDSLFKLAVQEK